MGDTITAKTTVLVDAKQAKIIAHRGLSGIECENSLAAFIAAGNRNYFGIETDVHVTYNGKFIIIHDDETNRVSNAKMSVENSDFNSLRSVLLNDKDGQPRADLHLPSLSEYLKTCKRYEKKAVLELKNRIEDKYIDQIVDAVKQEYSVEQTVFISFDYDNIVYVRKLLPDANIQYLYSEEINEELIAKLKKYSFDLDIWEGRLNKENIELLHKNGILVNCWTCDDEKRASELIEWNVDFITTNIIQPQEVK